MKKMYVVLSADTEDNHPNYMPYWGNFGSNYDTNPAGVRVEWIKYLGDMEDILEELDFKITWFLRVDNCVGDKILKALSPQDHLIDSGGEIGIHIHTIAWDGKIWRQTIDPQKEREIIEDSIELFRESVGFKPEISRMGWNAMSNSIMNALNNSGIKYDNSAVPNYSCSGMYCGRDNIMDWKRVHDKAYHPSHSDYQCAGDMKIIEIPISSLGKKSLFFSDSKINSVTGKGSLFLLEKAMAIRDRVMGGFNLSPHTIFMISPFWSNSNLRKIVDKKVSEAKNNGSSLLVGYFHPADILDPKSGGINRGFTEKLTDILSYINSSNSEVEVIPLTLSDAMGKFEDEHTTCKSA